MGVLVKAANTFKAFVYSLFGKKTLSDFTAELSEKKDSLRDKTVTGMTAKFTGVSDLLSSGQKTFGVTARFTDSTDSLTHTQKTLSSNAKELLIKSNI